MSALLLRVIARKASRVRNQVVALHSMAVTSRFICHIAFASIFFAFYWSNGVLYKGITICTITTYVLTKLLWLEQRQPSSVCLSRCYAHQFLQRSWTSVGYYQKVVN